MSSKNFKPIDIPNANTPDASMYGPATPTTLVTKILIPIPIKIADIVPVVPNKISGIFFFNFYENFYSFSKV